MSILQKNYRISFANFDEHIYCLIEETYNDGYQFYLIEKIAPFVMTNDTIANEARIWTARVTSNDMSAEEQSNFNIWLNESDEHKKQFKKAQAIWVALGSLNTDDDAKINNKLLEIPTLSQNEVVPVFLSPYKFKNGYMTAAIACLMFVCWVYSPDFWLLYKADISTSIGQQATHVLPDGSVAILNTYSALALDFTKKERKVYLLKGEVFFKVKKDKQRPFKVIAKNGVTEAIGTAFSVREKAEDVEVLVTEGTVKVYLTKNNSTQLKKPARIANKQMSINYNNEELFNSFENKDIENRLSWRHGKLTLVNMPLKQVIKEFNRYYPGYIILARSGNNPMPVNGVFSTYDLVSSVRAVALSYGLSVKEVPGSLMLIIH